MRKVALVILDGWGHGKKDESNAIFKTHTPYIDSLYETSLNTELKTDGEDVGLPKGQMGNSEVGHLNIGAGRVVFQDLVKINQDIKFNNFEKNNLLLNAFEKAKKKDKAIHIMGLFSDGGIHSHISHLKAICDVALLQNVKHIYIHAFTDGRDTDPKAGKKYVEDFLKYSKNKNISIVSIVGRYYAMDRDKRWERTALAYHSLVNGNGKKTKNLLKSIEEFYKKDITDEFITPLIKVDDEDKVIGRIHSDDIVICFNFRSDRCRQIVAALTQLDIPQYQTNSMDIDLYTMTNYDDTFKEINVLYPKVNIKNTLGEILANNNLKQLRIAETEKYPHVTFFFSGGREEEFPGEYRIMIPSPKVATYDLQPEMSADEVTTQFIQEVKTKKPDFICLNYANPDMVGHTGDFKAVSQAIRKIDECVEKIVTESVNENYTLIIIADHGNAEKMLNNDGSKHTAHTTNKVPCFIINSDYNYINSGRLCDITPTILKIMGISQPIEITGKSMV